MKVGDTVWVEVDSFFDIREVKIVKETDYFYIFFTPERSKPIRRKKNRFAKTKEELLEYKVEVLDWHLQTLKTNGEEIYRMYKEIYENSPEILL